MSNRPDLAALVADPARVGDVPEADVPAGLAYGRGARTCRRHRQVHTSVRSGPASYAEASGEPQTSHGRARIDGFQKTVGCSTAGTSRTPFGRAARSSRPMRRRVSASTLAHRAMASRRILRRRSIGETSLQDRRPPIAPSSRAPIAKEHSRRPLARPHESTARIAGALGVPGGGGVARGGLAGTTLSHVRRGW